MTATTALIRLADAQGVTDYAAKELHTLLLVYGDSMPTACARDLEALRVKLANDPAALTGSDGEGLK